MRSIHFVVINSKMEYGLEICGCSYFTILHPLRVLQKSFIRIISYETKLQHTLQLFKNFNISPIRNLYIYKTLKIFFDRVGRVNFVIFVRCQGTSLMALCPNQMLQYLGNFTYLPTFIKEWQIKKKCLKILCNHLMIDEGMNRYF